MNLTVYRGNEAQRWKYEEETGDASHQLVGNVQKRRKEGNISAESTSGEAQGEGKHVQ